MRIAASVCIALCIALLVGCSGSPPERSFYLLRSDQDQSSALAENPLVGIGRITIPAYLDRAELVVQAGPDEIRPARYNHWGEPLDDGVRHYLRSALAKRLGRPVGADVLIQSLWDYQVDLTIDTFHGGMSGGVELRGGFAISHGKDRDLVVAKRVVAQTRIDRDGHAALVSAHKRLLDQLADEIGAALEPQLSQSDGQSDSRNDG
jgi:uncharacterized lipoprotein YmbA